MVKRNKPTIVMAEEQRNRLLREILVAGFRSDPYKVSVSVSSKVPHLSNRGGPDREI